MPDPSRPPEWMCRELMARFDANFGPERPRRPTPEEESAASLREHGFDGSRMRRRYWKKVRFADGT